MSTCTKVPKLTGLPLWIWATKDWISEVLLGLPESLDSGGELERVPKIEARSRDMTRDTKPGPSSLKPVVSS